MARLQVNIDMPTDGEIAKMFDAVPILERYKVGDKVVREGGKIVLARARQLVPRGTQEDREKRSQSQRAQADWGFPLWKTMRMVLRRYAANAVAVIGPSWPKGNKAYFNSPRGRREVLWGRVSGRVRQYRNWIVQAFDETRPQQLTAMKARLTQLMREIWTRG